MSALVLVSEISPQVAVVTVDRKEALNALSRDLLTAIQEQFTALTEHKELRAVVLTGAGEKAFVAGADIREMMAARPNSSDIRDYVQLGQSVMRQIETFRVPVIAAVNGFALGGGLELALACDLIVAGERAKVGQPEVNLGILPGFGGTQRLLLRTSPATAKRLIYTAEIIEAAEALRLGVVDYVVGANDVLPRAVELAITISSKGPRAVQAAKRVMNGTLNSILISGLEAEVHAFTECFDSHERVEGMSAFLEKRGAKF